MGPFSIITGTSIPCPTRVEWRGWWCYNPSRRGSQGGAAPPDPARWPKASAPGHWPEGPVTLPVVPRIAFRAERPSDHTLESHTTAAKDASFVREVERRRRARELPQSNARPRDCGLCGQYVPTHKASRLPMCGHLVHAMCRADTPPHNPGRKCYAEHEFVGAPGRAEPCFASSAAAVRTARDERLGVNARRAEIRAAVQARDERVAAARKKWKMARIENLRHPRSDRARTLWMLQKVAPKGTRRRALIDAEIARNGGRIERGAYTTGNGVYRVPAVPVRGITNAQQRGFVQRALVQRARRLAKRWVETGIPVTGDRFDALYNPEDIHIRGLMRVAEKPFRIRSMRRAGGIDPPD